MKNIIFKFLIILVVSMSFTSCKDETNLPEGDIQILFITPQLYLDLNVADNPPIISVINSKNPLKSVKIYIKKTGGVEVLYMPPVVSFYTKNSYSLKEMPVYKEDMMGAKIIAEDVTGKIVEMVLPFAITPMKNAPDIIASSDSITVKEGNNTIPPLTVQITGQIDLKYVRISKVVNRTEFLVDTIKTFSPTNQFAFDINKYPIPSDLFQPKMSLIKFEAVDIYGKVKIAGINVNFIEVPAPIVTFTGYDGHTTITMNEYTNPTFSGQINSSSDMTSLTVTLKGTNATPLVLDQQTFTGSIKQYPFSYQVNRIQYNYNSLEVKVTDALNKVTTAILPIQVIELSPAPVVNSDDYQGILRTSSITLGSDQKPFITSGAGIKHIKLETYNLAGTIMNTLIDADFPSNPTSYNYPTPISASDITLGDIKVTVTDLNDKVTIKDIPVTVEFYLLKNIIMGPETVVNPLANSTSPVFFSAIDRKFLSPTEAFYKQTNCEFFFYNPASFPGRIYLYPMSHSDAANKYGGSSGANIKVDGQNAGPGAWLASNRNSTVFGAFSNATMPQSQFGQYTVDDIKGKTATSTSCTFVYMNSGESTVSNNGTTTMVVFHTVSRNGKVQRGLLKYEGIAPTSASQVRGTATTYLVSVQLTIPY